MAPPPRETEMAAPDVVNWTTQIVLECVLDLPSQIIGRGEGGWAMSSVPSALRTIGARESIGTSPLINPAPADEPANPTDQEVVTIDAACLLRHKTRYVHLM